MSRLHEPVIDQYSGFDHKYATQHPELWLSPIVPHEDTRRQMAYIVARAIHENVSRTLLPIGREDFEDELREYGDPSAYASALAGGVLGSEMTVSVAGADLQLPDAPVLPDAPEPPSAPDPHGVLNAAHQAQVEVWRTNSQRVIDAWKARHLEQPLLKEAQEWLREWADKSRIESVLREMYRELVQPMGEGVLALRASPGRYPEVDIWDPESYFPLFENGEVSEFPDLVDLGYEFEDDDGAKWVRRVRYELVPLVSNEDLTTPGTRRLEYQDEPTSVTCVMTDASFKMDGLRREWRDIHGLNDSDAESFAVAVNDRGQEVPVRSLDLGIDFIPVVHFPAGPSKRTHFGRSAYLRAAQLFDDLAAADTSVTSAANLAGNPPMVVSGAILSTGPNGKVNMGPGVVVPTPESGSLTKLSMSDELRSLMEYRSDLKARTSEIMQVPEGMMGTASPEKIASGILLELSLTPFQRVTMEGRLAAGPKLSLLLKMVMRMAVIAKSPGWEKVQSVPPAAFKLGSFMPTDMPALVEMISVLRSAKVVSRKVAATWLQAAGMDIEDVDQLLAELDAEDTESALDLHAMFGVAAAAKRLGIEVDQDRLDEIQSEADNSGLGRFGSAIGGGLDRGRARPERALEPGEDPTDL